MPSEEVCVVVVSGNGDGNLKFPCALLHEASIDDLEIHSPPCYRQHPCDLPLPCVYPLYLARVRVPTPFILLL